MTGFTAGNAGNRLKRFTLPFQAPSAGRGMEVIGAKICRLNPNLPPRLEHLEKAKVDAIVTLHLPIRLPLESGKSLCERVCGYCSGYNARFFIWSFQLPDRIMFNHGHSWRAGHVQPAGPRQKTICH